MCVGGNLTVEARPRTARRSGVDTFLLLMRITFIVVISVGFLAFVAQQIDADNVFARWANPDAIALTRDQIEVLIVSGLTQGALYGLIALGYSMVYGVLGFINFAHGEVFMVSAMTGAVLSKKLEAAGTWESNFVLSLLLTVLIASLCSTLTAIAMERIAYRPLRGSPRLIPLITSIGVSFFLQNAVLVLLGSGPKSYAPRPDWLQDKHGVFGFELTGTQALVLAVAASSMGGLWFLVERTKTGKAMRAVAEDKEIASLMGIDVDRVIVTTFAVGGAMAGIAGVMYGLLFGSVTHTTGFLPGIKAFSAAVVGGIGNLGGAMAGGLSIGGAESLGPQLVLEPLGIPGHTQLKDAVAFLALIFVLLVKPTGLFGERLSTEDRA
jgi:branched-chain amino acid transport system permease protein